MPIKNYKSQPALKLNLAKTVVENLKIYGSSFALAKTTFTNNYQKELSNKIDEIAEKFLGKGKLAEQRKTTLALRDKLEESNKYVRILRILIFTEFDEEKQAIIKEMNINSKSLKQLGNKNRKAIVDLLKCIDKCLTEDLIAKLNSKSINPAISTKIKKLAIEVPELIAKQESITKVNENLTEEAYNSFQQIFKEVNLICRLAPKVIKDKKVAKEKFNVDFLQEQFTGTKPN